MKHIGIFDSSPPYQSMDNAGDKTNSGESQSFAEEMPLRRHARGQSWSGLDRFDGLHTRVIAVQCPGDSDLLLLAL